MELWQYDATDLARLIRNGQASAREAVDSVLGRLHKVNPAINAVVRVLEDDARAQAETADAARARGHALPPLHGVPVTTKINVDQAGLPTDNGVIPLKDLIAKEDSPVVANLKHAGAIIVGRTNAPAFSMRIFTDNALHGRTLNPRDPSVTPGGSSGGAGAAVATGIGPIAHGNDIGGSVRIPAYCNGVVGLRTGFARIPSLNPTAAASGRPIGAVLMAVQGPHTRTVRDARLALEVMARGDRRDWRWNDVPMQGPPPARPIKVAIVPEVPGGKSHPAQAAAVRQAGKHLQAAGYVVEEMLPPDIERGVELWHEICVTDVIGGRVTMLFTTTISAAPQIKAGKVKGLALTSAKRLDTMPGVPTIGETLKGYQAEAFQGMIAPAGVPRAIIEKLGREVAAIVKSPEIGKTFEASGAVAVGSTHAEFSAFLNTETAKWGTVIREAGIKLEQ